MTSRPPPFNGPSKRSFAPFYYMPPPSPFLIFPSSIIFRIGTYILPESALGPPLSGGSWSHMARINPFPCPRKVYVYLPLRLGLGIQVVWPSSPPYICPPRYRSPVLPQADALRPYPLTSALHCRMGSVDPAVAVRHIAPRRDALLKLRATTAPVLFPLVCLILYA
jgi:hypothetical protein